MEEMAEGMVEVFFLFLASDLVNMEDAEDTAPTDLWFSPLVVVVVVGGGVESVCSAAERT